MNNERLARALKRLDEMNAEDPHKKELPFADRLEAWVRRLDPTPSEELIIAARGQHVRRWTIPRDSYPEGRAAYLRWREELKHMHSATVVQIMRDEGYEEAVVDRAKQIVLKKNLTTNPDTQTIEDALCLVFLETQFENLL